ncbi:MAG TPA: DUF4340 domain-containing protein [Planctomycetes bacterium]|nr:DUF4340 domain-containing protein [Planctomycetota bacterium]
MKITRRNVQLFVLLLALVGADLALSPRGSVVGFAGDGLVDGIDWQQVSRIRITGGDGTVTLERSGDGFGVAEYGGFPAHEGVVSEFLRRIVAIGPADLVASEEESVERFGLGSTAVRALLSDEEGSILADLRFAPAPDAKAGCVLRLADSTRIFRTAALTPPIPEPIAWIDSRVLDLDAPRVRVLRLHTAGSAEQTLVRQENGLWSLEGSGETLRPARVDPLLLIASSLYLEDVLADPDLEALGLAPPELSCSFELDGGELRRVELGSDQEGVWTVTTATWGDRWAGILGERTAQNLLGAAERVLSRTGSK